MWRLSKLFLLKLSFTTFLVNIVLPATFILNDRVLGFEKTGSNQLSFLTLSLLFNLIIIPSYSLILVSQNLNWLIMMPISRLKLVLFSYVLRVWSFSLGLFSLIATQFLMEKFYYSNLSNVQAKNLIHWSQSVLEFRWMADIDWSYSSFALVFSIICIFLSGFVLNFDMDSRNYRFTATPLLFLLKGKIRAIIGLSLLVLFFGFISLSRANIFIILSLSLPFFMMISCNVFVLGRKAVNFVKVVALLIIFVHVSFIFLAREELKSDKITLKRTINNFEYLEIYTPSPDLIAGKILNKMLEQKKIDTYFIKAYFEELDSQILYELVNYPLQTEELDNLTKFVPQAKLDPFFFDPILSLSNKNSADSSLRTLSFFNIGGLSTDHIHEVLSLLSRRFPSSIYYFYQVMSKRKFQPNEILSFINNEDKAIVKFGLILLRYYPEVKVTATDLMDLIQKDPLLIEDTYKTVIVRTGEYIDINRLIPTLPSMDLNRIGDCPTNPRALFNLAGDKGSYLLYTICLRSYLDGVVQPPLEQMEVIENPFFGNHLDMAKSILRINK